MAAAVRSALPSGYISCLGFISPLCFHNLLSGCVCVRARVCEPSGVRRRASSEKSVLCLLFPVCCVKGPWETPVPPVRPHQPFGRNKTFHLIYRVQASVLSKLPSYILHTHTHTHSWGVFRVPLVGAQ